MNCQKQVNMAVFPTLSSILLGLSDPLVGPLRYSLSRKKKAATTATAAAATATEATATGEEDIFLLSMARFFFVD